MVKARGELSVFVLYGAEDTEAPVQWLEYSLPFSGEVECPDCTEELIPLIEASVMHQSRWGRTDPCFGCCAGAGYEIFQGRGI